MVEMKVLGLGTWKSRNVTITEAMIDSAIAQFKARGLLIPVDKQHEEEEAYGWIHDLYKKDGELWASIEWNEKGAELIKSEQFKYISPTLAFNGEDQRTASIVPMELYGLAITNYPYMNDLSELRAKRDDRLARLKNAEVYTFSYDKDYNQVNTFRGANMDIGEIVKKITADCELPPETPPDEVAAYVKKLMDVYKMVPQEGGAPPTPEGAAELMPEMSQNHKTVKELATMLKCDAKNVKAEVAKLSKKPEAKHEPDEETIALKAKVASLETRLEASKREIEADKFIAEFSRKIPPAQQDAVKAAYMKDPEIVKSLYTKDAPDIIQTVELSKTIDPKTLVLTDSQKEAAAKAGVSEDEYKAEFAKAIAKRDEFERMMRGGA